MLSTILSSPRHFFAKERYYCVQINLFPQFLIRQGHSMHRRAVNHAKWRAIDCALWAWSSNCAGMYIAD